MTSPNQPGVEGTDSAEVWIHTELSVILVISTSLLGTVLFFPFKEAYFYTGSLPVTSRCAIRGRLVGGIDGSMRARWKEDWMRFREFWSFPGVCSHICSVLHKKDFHSTIFIQDVAQCQPWFLTRFVFYIVIGPMFGYSGYEVIHAGAIALHDNGASIAGSPGSGKSTLILSCLESGLSLMADDVLFLAKDDGQFRV
jgi:hypothetical protein